MERGEFSYIPDRDKLVAVEGEVKDSDRKEEGSREIKASFTVDSDNFENQLVEVLKNPEIAHSIANDVKPAMDRQIEFSKVYKEVENRARELGMISQESNTIGTGWEEKRKGEDEVAYEKRMLESSKLIFKHGGVEYKREEVGDLIRNFEEDVSNGLQMLREVKTTGLDKTSAVARNFVEKYAKNYQEMMFAVKQQDFLAEQFNEEKVLEEGSGIGKLVKILGKTIVDIAFSRRRSPNREDNDMLLEEGIKKGQEMLDSVWEQL